MVEVHDLHVWEVTSGFPALSAHVLVGADSDCHAARRQIEAMLHERFALDHTTLQVDHVGSEPSEILQLELAPARARASAGLRPGLADLAARADEHLVDADVAGWPIA